MQLVDNRGFPDARVPGDEHQFGPAAGDGAIESREQRCDLRFAPVQFLRDHEAVWSVTLTRRECMHAAVRVPFRQAAPEVAFEGRRGLIAFLCALCEQLHGDGGHRHRNAGRSLAGVGRLTRDVGMHPLHRIGGCERKMAGQHLVEGDAERIQIASGIDGAVHPARLLGRHVGERSCDELRRFRRLPFAREARCNAEAGEPYALSGRIHDHVGRLEVLVNEPTSVKSTQCARHRCRKLQEPARFHGIAYQPIKRCTSGKLDNQHGVAGLANKFYRAQRPLDIQIVLEFELVCEPIDPRLDRMRRAGDHRYEGVPVAGVAIVGQSAEGTIGVFPQYFRTTLVRLTVARVHGGTGRLSPPAKARRRQSIKAASSNGL